jgi:NAD-dependent SIR2 family protein deacetylase
MTRSWDSVDPNPGHYAIVELQKLGKMRFLISQNVDNLHLKSGIKTELLAELHGNMTKLRCTGCGQSFNPNTEPTPCQCGKDLVSSVVDFGQSLPERDLRLSFEHADKSDLFIVVGSSLVVTPAADIPREAFLNNARLVIINQDTTPLEANAHLRFREPIGDVLPRTVKRLKRLMRLFE